MVLLFFYSKGRFSHKGTQYYTDRTTYCDHNIRYGVSISHGPDFILERNACHKVNFSYKNSSSKGNEGIIGLWAERFLVIPSCYCGLGFTFIVIVCSIIRISNSSVPENCVKLYKSLDKVHLLPT